MRDIEINNLYYGFLDSEKLVRNYFTQEYNGQCPIDENTTGIDYYNKFLNPYNATINMRLYNVTGSVEYMTPMEYYEECAKNIFIESVSGLTVNKLIEHKASQINSINAIRDVLDVYNKKLCMPFIDYEQLRQEGLHRMLVVAEKHGWEYKVPILVIKYMK